MTKEAFFRNLEERLKGLPEAERQSIMRVYEDLFTKAAENGKDESEIARSLGHASFPEAFPPADRKTVPYGAPASGGFEFGLRGLLVSLSLGFINLLLIGPFLGFTAVLAALAVVALVLVTSALWILLGSGVPTDLTTLLSEVFASLAFTGLGVLLSLGLVQFTRWYARGVKKYIRFNMRLIRGK